MQASFSSYFWNFFCHEKIINDPLSNDLISLLPHEVTSEIFSYLSVKELSNANMVCKKWKNLTDDDELWKNLCLKLAKKEGLVLDKAENLSWKLFYKSITFKSPQLIEKKPLPETPKKNKAGQVCKNIKFSHAVCCAGPSMGILPVSIAAVVVGGIYGFGYVAGAGVGVSCCSGCCLCLTAVSDNRE